MKMIEASRPPPLTPPRRGEGNGGGPKGRRVSEILMEYRREYFAKQRAEGLHEVGVGRQRSDLPGHVVGKTQYYADRSFPGMLHLKMVRSPHHHARIRSIDIAKALQVPGVVRVLTASDVPQN